MVTGSTRLSRLDCLVALHNCEPATSKLVSLTRGVGECSTTTELLTLIRDGLATREKIDPYSDAPLTDEELRYRNRPVGKRPYAYSLTLTGRIAAAHLATGYRILERHERRVERNKETRPANEDLPVMLRRQAD